MFEKILSSLKAIAKKRHVLRAWKIQKLDNNVSRKGHGVPIEHL